jgi:hypothetical protein
MAHWAVRVKTSEEDMETGKIRSKSETFLVRAETMEESQRKVREYFRGMTIDYELRAVSKSNIMGYIDNDGNATE